MTKQELFQLFDEWAEKGLWQIPEGENQESYIQSQVDKALADNPIIAKMEAKDVKPSTEQTKSETPFRDFLRHSVALSTNNQKVMAEYREKDHVIGTDASGGYVVPTEDAREILDLTVNDSAVMSLCRVVRPSTNAINFPTLSSGFAGYWVAESTDAAGGTAAFTEETVTFGQQTLTLYKVGIFTVVSKELLEDSDPSVEAILRQNMADSLAAAGDFGALHGTGAAGAATSASLITGLESLITTNVFSAAGGLSFDNIIDLMTPEDNAGGAISLITCPAARRELMKVKDNDGRPIYETGAMTGSLPAVSGMPLALSREVSKTLGGGSETAIFAGSFGTSGLFGIKNGLSITVDPYSYAQLGSVKIVAMTRMGFQVADESHFAILNGVSV